MRTKHRLKNRFFVWVCIAFFVSFIFCFLTFLSLSSVYAEEYATDMILPDGVYALQNKASSYYVDIRLDSRNTNAYIQQYNYGHVPGTEEERSGLYRIERTGNTGCYVIRTLRNSNNCLTVNSNGEIVTADFSSEGLDTQRWRIVYDGSGFYQLISVSNDGVITAQDTLSSGSAGGSNSILKTMSSSINENQDLGNRDKWKLYKYEGLGFSGFDLELIGSHVLSQGATMDVSGMLKWSYFYSTTINQNSPGNITGYSLLYPSGNSGATLIASITSGGILSGVSGKTGMVAIRPTYDSGCVPNNYPNVYIEPGNGEFFFMTHTVTAFTSYYITGNAPYIRQRQFTYDANQIWEIVPVSNNVSDPVLIRCVSSGMYLTSPASTQENVRIQLQPIITGEEYNSRQLWYVTEVGKNSIKLQSKYQKSNVPNLYVAVQYDENSYLVQQNAICFFNKIPIGYDVSMLSIWENNRDRTLQYHDVAGVLFSYFDSFGYHFDVSTNASAVSSILEQSKIFISRSHGSPSVIQLNQSADNMLRKENVATLNLSNTDIVMFMGCSTCDGSSTITHAALNAGAKVAIGTTESISVSAANEWVNTFFLYLSAGMTVYQATSFTNEYVTGEQTHFLGVYLGDGVFVLE